MIPTTQCFTTQEGSDGTITWHKIVAFEATMLLVAGRIDVKEPWLWLFARTQYEQNWESSKLPFYDRRQIQSWNDSWTFESARRAIEWSLPPLSPWNRIQWFRRFIHRQINNSKLWVYGVWCFRHFTDYLIFISSILENGTEKESVQSPAVESTIRTLHDTIT